MRTTIFRMICCLLVLAAAALPSLTRAASRNNSWELGAFGQYVNFDNDLGVDNGAGFGGRIGYNFIGGHELEFTGSYTGTEENFTGLDLDTDVTTWTVGYLYNWTPDDDVVPFFTGGIGSANTDIDVLGSESDFTIYLGGGTRFYLNDRVSIRLDGRWMHIDTSPSTNNGVFTAGVSWVLGRGR